MSSAAAPGATATAPLPSASLPAGPGRVPTRVALGGVSAAVVAVTTLADGSLQIPARPSVVGWWDLGSAPADGVGTTVLAGHVDSHVYGIGVFAKLWSERPGDVVRLSDRAGRAVTYRVVSNRRYAKTALPVRALFVLGGAPRLVMITCSGAFTRNADGEGGHYADNTVVIAVPA